MIQRDTSQSIISLIKQQQKSVSKSHLDIFGAKKQQLLSSADKRNTTLSAQIYKPPCNLLRSVSRIKQSIPYRLHIKKIHNIPQITKKSNSSSTTLFVSLSVNVFVMRKRDGVSMQVYKLGESHHYQCQQGLFRRDESKHVFPIMLYYHSKVDKNSHQMFLTVKVNVLQIKDGLVQNTHYLGFMVIENPLIESAEQNISLCRQQLFQVQYALFQSYKQMSKASQGPMIDYEITSFIELKKLVKLVPENTVFTPSYQVVGLNDEFLTNHHQIQQTVQSSSLNLKFKYLQVHIPQTFEQGLLQTLKKYPNNLITPKDQIKSRKVTISYLTTSKQGALNTIEKKLQFVEKQNVSDWKLMIYQALKDDQTINFPYYIEDAVYPLAMALTYQVGDKQLQVAQYLFTPITNNQNQDISEQMVTNELKYPIKSPYLIKTNFKNKPTIITQYTSQLPILNNEDSLSSPVSDAQFYTSQTFKTSQTFLKTSQNKLLQGKAQQLKEKQRLLQQIQYQKVQLQKQRNQIQKARTQNYVNYQEDFQRRFQLQKQSLMKRQQMLESQYREQVERQIREKSQLQTQIKLMKQRFKKMQQERQGPQNRQEYQEDRQNGMAIQGGGYPHPGAKPFMSGNFHRTGFNNNSYQQVNNLKYNSRQNFNQKHQIDPSYLIQPQHPLIPINKVRQLIRRPNLNKQLVQKSKTQYNRASRFTFTFSSILWLQNITHPKQIYFVIRFFNFPQYKTDKLTYLQQKDSTNYQQGQYCRLIRSHHNSYNINQDIDPVYTFTIDPSQYRNPRNLQQDLIQYLNDNNCIVDIFDGDTHIYMGQINIKLSQLIRGNKTQTFIAMEYNLIKIKAKQNLGRIQIVLKNQEDVCKSTLSMNMNAVTSVIDEKKKVISYAPMVVPKEQKALGSNSQRINTGAKTMTSNRIQERITKFKQRQRQRKLEDQSGNFKVLHQEDKKNIMTKISNYKNKNMKEYIKTVYSSLLHQNIRINAEFGKAETFPYTFVNQSTYASSYKIVIDSDGSQPGSYQCPKKGVPGDLSVVKQAAEWRYYIKKKQIQFIKLRNYPQPKFYQIINQDNTFYLNPGQSLSMLFKYLSFTHFSTMKKFSSQDVRINVSIIKIDSNFIAGGFSLSVDPHEQIVHHSYILYEPGNQIVQLTLPVIYTNMQDYGPKAVKKLFVTDEDDQTQASWLNQYEIVLRISTPQIMQRKSFNLLLYDDEYFDELRENWLIVVNSYEGVWAQCRPDSNTKFKLALPMNVIPVSLGLDFYSSSLNNSLVLNSSDPSLEFGDNKILAEFGKMREGGAYEIWCQLLSSQNYKKQIEITCTSEESSTLVYAWILQIFPYSAKRA